MLRTAYAAYIHCYGTAIVNCPWARPYAIINAAIAHVSEEDWSILEYKCFAISSIHGHLAMTCKNVTTKVANATIFSCPQY